MAQTKELERISAEIGMLVEHLTHGVTTGDIEQLDGIKKALDSEIEKIKTAK